MKSEIRGNNVYINENDKRLFKLTETGFEGITIGDFEEIDYGNTFEKDDVLDLEIRCAIDKNSEPAITERYIFIPYGNHKHSLTGDEIKRCLCTAITDKFHLNPFNGDKISVTVGKQKY